MHVAQLRRKLGRPELIRTLRGTGYKAVADVRSLRARLFAATLAALALTLALTIAIGAVLTRRQVDRAQAAALAARADDLAVQRRRNVSYQTENQVVGERARIVISRARPSGARPEREP